MRIISWNIRFNNRRAIQAIKSALLYDADVLCLQEVPQKALAWLRKLDNYSVNASYDFSHSRDPRKNGYICTVTKSEAVEATEVNYDHSEHRSILNRVFYRMMNHHTEHHTGLVVLISTPQGPVRIVNTRLSCAIGTRDRLTEFQTLLEHVSTDNIPTIFCGDFNVVDSKLFNRITGWLRGFKSFDYRINERGAFEALYKKAKLVNIFRGQPTMFFNKPTLQFDHILVPQGTHIDDKQIPKKRYGSDHRMLLTDISLSLKTHE
jgi:endonuclease/exonuclease/phosphatase family metal-dependent hydrolase